MRKPKRDPKVFVLATGSRDFTDDYIVGIFIHGMRLYHGLGLELYHGAAKGADTMAAEATKVTNGWITNPFPADWAKDGKAAGPIRNKRMLEAMLKAADHPDDICMCIAFKDDLGAQRHPDGHTKGGTEHMIRLCQEADVPVYHLECL